MEPGARSDAITSISGFDGIELEHDCRIDSGKADQYCPYSVFGGSQFRQSA
jgi:hypothetical protein